MMRSVPIQGCAFWQREPGSDDELPIGEQTGARALAKIPSTEAEDVHAHAEIVVGVSC